MTGRLVKFSNEFLDGLKNAGQIGPRSSDRWDTYFIFPELGKFPARIKVEKQRLDRDGVYLLLPIFRKKGMDARGAGYAIDHCEFRCYRQKPDQLAENSEKVFVFDFVFCEKNEDVVFSITPVDIWRMTGTEKRGIAYVYDPENPPEIKVERVSSEILDRFTVWIELNGAKPIKGHSIVDFPKYEMINGGHLYDRRKNRNASGGIIEVVKNTKDSGFWKYLNLKDGETVTEAAVLAVQPNGKLAILKDGKVVSW